MKKWYISLFIMALIVQNALCISAPSLSAPKDAATDQAWRPTFTWGLVSGAGSYKIQISKTGNFDVGDDFADQGFNLTTPSYICAVDLPAVSYFKWRVIAFTGSDNSGDEAISELRGFYTKALIPPIPSLMLPPDGATLQSTQPTLSWNSVVGATAYWYQISTTSTFSPTYTVVNTNNDVLTSSNKLNPNTKYWWHVCSYNTTGTSAYSAPYTFTTAAVAVPSTPNLISPAVGAQISGTSVTITWSATNATDFWVQVFTSLGNITGTIVQENKHYVGTSWAIPGLMAGTTYYWKVLANNGGNSSGWGGCSQFTCLQPSGSPIWPRGDASQIQSPFGPRNLSGATSWFHTGVDIAGTGFKAPYNMVCVIKSVGTKYFRLIFKCLDAGKEPKHLQFEELNLANKDVVNVGTSFVQGATIAVGGGASANWLHMEAYQGTDCVISNEDDPANSTDQTDNLYATNRTKTKNPLQWFPPPLGVFAGTYLAIFPAQNASTFPQEGGVSYFDVYIKSTSPIWSLDQINVDLTNQKGSLNNAALQDQTGSRISFNNGSAVDRAQDSPTSSSMETNTNFANTTVTGYTKTINGVKVFTKDVNYTAPYTKELVFRYYLSSTDIASIRVAVNDYNGSPLESGVRTIGPGCVNCPGNGPIPPDYLAATPCGNGIELRWNKSPDKTQTTYFYSIYRRIDGSTEMPQVIAIVPYMSLLYSDLFSNPINTLIPGKKYRYSIASVGAKFEGCNGPLIPNCAGLHCPIGCVAEKVATAPSTPMDVVFQGQIVRTNIGTITAKNSITATYDQFRKSGAATLTAGYKLELKEPITIEDGSPVNLNVTH